MSLESLRRIWEILADMNTPVTWALADEIMAEILARTIARDAILDFAEASAE